MAVKVEKKISRARIGVLMGGPSSEREISFKSGKAVYDALIKSGLNAVAVEIDSSSARKNVRLLNKSQIDCAFIALHGKFGEDGGIQNILDVLKIPYTGSGVKASSLAMDKVASKKIFERGGLRVPRHAVFDKKPFKNKNDFCLKLGLPLVIKPASHGSSIGMSIINKERDLAKAIQIAFEFDNKIIIEEYISGRELTVGILGTRALPIIEIVPKRQFFDFQAKYKGEGTEYIVPAKLNKKVAKEIQKSALSAHRLLGCFGCSRVDIILDKHNSAFILEINTIPGFTSTSLLPKAAKAVNIGFAELCLKLISLAYEKK